MTTDGARYSEREFRDRLAARKERIDAAVTTGMLLHEESREAFIAARPIDVLPDGRISLDRERFDVLLRELGRVMSHSYLETVLRAIYSEDA